jgi:hypothetical protein
MENAEALKAALHFYIAAASFNRCTGRQSIKSALPCFSNRAKPVCAVKRTDATLLLTDYSCAPEAPPSGLRAATFSFSLFSTDGNTNLLTSPPSCAISRTIVPEMNWY